MNETIYKEVGNFFIAASAYIIIILCWTPMVSRDIIQRILQLRTELIQ